MPHSRPGREGRHATGAPRKPHPQRDPSNHHPRAGSAAHEDARERGIRLFPGDRMVAERKAGATKGDVAVGLLQRPTAFHVVAADPEKGGCIKVRFDAPPGVFITTVRLGSEPVLLEKEGVDSDLEVRFLEVEPGQAVVVTPAGGAIEAAASLFQGGYSLTCWRDPLSKDLLLRVEYPSVWKVEVLSSHQVSTEPLRPGTPADRKQVAFLSAYIKAAEELLPQDLQEQIRRRAWEIARGK